MVNHNLMNWVPGNSQLLRENEQKRAIFWPKMGSALKLFRLSSSSSIE
jgi:hypothetical protein